VESQKNLTIINKQIFKIDRGHKVNGTVNAVSVVKALNKIKNLQSSGTKIDIRVEINFFFLRVALKASIGALSKGQAFAE
jgi:hypothetical protein